HVTPFTQLFSGDTLFLLGTREQIQSSVNLLNREDLKTATASTLHRSILRSLIITPTSPLVGRSIGEIDWSRHLGVQILALRSGGREFINPPANRALAPDDQLLIAGTEDSI